MRILILGLDNAGKTTILRKFCGEPTDGVEPTLGFNIKTIEHRGYRLNVWDVGGQRTIRAYWRNYFERTDGVIWVVDSTDGNRMGDCKKELWSLLGQERLAGATVLVLANKQDVGGSAGEGEIREALGLGPDEVREEGGRGGECEAVGMGPNRHWSIYGCSALTGEGLKDAMDWLVEDISGRIFLLD